MLRQTAAKTAPGTLQLAPLITQPSCHHHCCCSPNRQASSSAGQPFREHPQKLATPAASPPAHPQMALAASLQAHSPPYLAADQLHLTLVSSAASVLLLLRCRGSRLLQRSTGPRQEPLLQQRGVAVATAAVPRRAVTATAIISRAWKSCSCLMASLLETDCGCCDVCAALRQRLLAA
jgi:hypothetical protein